LRHAHADTYEGLAHVEDVVKSHLERWGEGDTLKVEWQLRTPLP
jgi:hypothetical protein